MSLAGTLRPKFPTWVYVTGAPRSGTTFVGKVLSAPLSVDYIHEPFNPDCGLAVVRQRYLYLRPGSTEDAPYREPFGRIFSYRFRLRTGYYRNDTRWQRLAKRFVGSRGPFYLRLAKLNPFHRAAVIKDPVGCLLTEYLQDLFPVRPVVLIRHPATFVASLRKLGWEADLADLTGQPRLLEDHFPPGDPLRAGGSGDRLEDAARLWRALNKVLLAQAARHPDWIVLTHEELSREPVRVFEDLYRRLGLPWSERVERLVARMTSGRNRLDPGGGRVQDFRRNSADLFRHTLMKLSRDERERVYRLTEDVAGPLYPRESFALNE